MKILVDAKELDKAFNAVANAKNHFTSQSYAIQQLQIACDIIGPMWVHGVNDGKTYMDGIRFGVEWSQEVQDALVNKPIKAELSEMDLNELKESLKEDLGEIKLYKHFDTREAVLEILDMLIYFTYRPNPGDCGRAQWRIDQDLHNDAKSLKAKMVGER